MCAPGDLLICLSWLTYVPFQNEKTPHIHTLTFINCHYAVRWCVECDAWKCAVPYSACQSCGKPTIKAPVQRARYFQNDPSPQLATGILDIPQLSRSVLGELLANMVAVGSNSYSNDSSEETTQH